MRNNLGVMALTIFLGSAVAHADEGVSSGSSTAHLDRSEGCNAAKSDADYKIPPNAHVTGHTACDCSKDTRTELWSCTVDANWRSDNKAT
jgi:hypothetical protein